MVVIDASVVVDALVGIGARGERARSELREQPILRVPAIFPAEAASALRAMLLRGAISSQVASIAVAQVHSIRATPYPFEPFLARVWELRDNLTVYDAWYVALAERLHIDLVTDDDRLLTAAGPQCTVRRPKPAR